MNEDIQLVFGIRTNSVSGGEASRFCFCVNSGRVSFLSERGVLHDPRHANVSGRTLSQLAVENYIYQEPSMPADYISFQSDVQRFDRMVLQTMEESATGFAYCKDLDTLYILDQPDEEIVTFGLLPRFSTSRATARAWTWSVIATMRRHVCSGRFAASLVDARIHEVTRFTRCHTRAAAGIACQTRPAQSSRSARTLRMEQCGSNSGMVILQCSAARSV